MPYIKAVDRGVFDEITDSLPAFKSPGDLNYFLTRLAMAYIAGKGGISYTNCNEAIGVLECVKQELYRRVVAPYEDQKALENGDVIDFKHKA